MPRPYSLLLWDREGADPADGYGIARRQVCKMGRSGGVGDGGLLYERLRQGVEKVEHVGGGAPEEDVLERRACAFIQTGVAVHVASIGRNYAARRRSGLPVGHQDDLLVPQ